MGDLLAAWWQDVKAYWRRPWMRWVAPSAAALLTLVLATDGVSAGVSLRVVLIVGTIVVATRALWHVSNRVPTVPGGHVGIVVAITAESAAQGAQLRRDFVATLREQLAADKETTRFTLLELPSWIAERCSDSESASRVLAEARGHLLVYGTAAIRRSAGKEVHVLEANGVVRHAPVRREHTAELAGDFRAVLPARILVPRDDDLLAFNATSELTAIAARYVIAIAAMISADLVYAENLLLTVESRLRRSGSKVMPLAHLARRLPERFIQLYSLWLDALFEAYFLTRSEQYLQDADRVAAALLVRAPNNYQAHLFAAIAHFVLRRDVAAAKRAVRACRPLKDGVWRYSHAFLYAYEGNLKGAREEYERAFRAPLAQLTVPVQVEEFIQLVLEKEPDKIQLHFFSGLVNLRAKEDTAGAMRDFEAFLNAGADKRYPELAAEARLYLAELSGGQAG